MTDGGKVVMEAGEKKKVKSCDINYLQITATLL